MKIEMDNPPVLDFKKRKVVQYSLIFCVLLVQLVIAGFFYNEYKNKESLMFIEKQLKKVQHLEGLTSGAKVELSQAQDHLQDYLKNDNPKSLDAYFASLNNLNSKIESISQFNNQHPKFSKLVSEKTRRTTNPNDLKVLIDSMRLLSTQTVLKKNEALPNLKKYNLDYDFGKLEVETKTFSDSTKKKGLFGRLKDAVAGNVTTKKDSTVVTVKTGASPKAINIKHEMDSLYRSVVNHYTKEVQRIKVKAIRNQNARENNEKFFNAFNNLFVYSAGMMEVYDTAAKTSKSDLENEFAKQNAKTSKTRYLLLWILFGLLFLMSLMILYFTKIAFQYETKLNEANNEIKENLKFKNRILGMLSHEIRSPLKIMGLFINRIAKKTNDDTVQEYLKSISFTNDSLLLQANQILEYTKNQQVGNKLVPVVFNLKNEISSILTAIQPYVESRHNQLLVQETIDPQFMVYSDKAKVHQVFINILANANKFTENGKITVLTKAEKLNDEVIVLKTEITDTGAGIAKEDLERIFEPYYQGVLSEEVDNLGAGLGLSLCKELLALFDGEISAASELGKGTTVSFSFNFQVKK